MRGPRLQGTKARPRAAAPRRSPGAAAPVGAVPGPARLAAVPGRGVQALLERLQLVAQLGGELVAELGVVLLYLRQLQRPLLGIDLQELGHHLLADVEAIGVDAARAGRRDPPDRRLHGLGAADHAAEDPGQDARVLAASGPPELPVPVLAEPVDVEDQ